MEQFQKEPNKRKASLPVKRSYTQHIQTADQYDYGTGSSSLKKNRLDIENRSVADDFNLSIDLVTQRSNVTVKSQHLFDQSLNSDKIPESCSNHVRNDFYSVNGNVPEPYSDQTRKDPCLENDIEPKPYDQTTKDPNSVNEFVPEPCLDKTRKDTTSSSVNEIVLEPCSDHTRKDSYLVNDNFSRHMAVESCSDQAKKGPISVNDTSNGGSKASLTCANQGINNQTLLNNFVMTPETCSDLARSDPISVIDNFSWDLALESSSHQAKKEPVSVNDRLNCDIAPETCSDCVANNINSVNESSYCVVASSPCSIHARINCTSAKGDLDLKKDFVIERLSVKEENQSSVYDNLNSDISPETCSNKVDNDQNSVSYSLKHDVTAETFSNPAEDDSNLASNSIKSDVASDMCLKRSEEVSSSVNEGYSCIVASGTCSTHAGTTEEDFDLKINVFKKEESENVISMAEKIYSDLVSEKGKLANAGIENFTSDINSGEGILAHKELELVSQDGDPNIAIKKEKLHPAEFDTGKTLNLKCDVTKDSNYGSANISSGINSLNNHVNDTTQDVSSEIVCSGKFDFVSKTDFTGLLSKTDSSQFESTSSGNTVCLNSTGKNLNDSYEKQLQRESKTDTAIIKQEINDYADFVGHYNFQESSLSSLPSTSSLIASAVASMEENNTLFMSCPDGSYTSPSAAHMDTHLKSHKTKKMYNCPNCDFQTPKKAGLRRHSLTHSDEKPWACSHCDFRTKREENLKVHLLRHDEDAPRFQCEKCDFSAVEKGTLVRHVRLVHEGDRPFSCSVCGFAFKQAHDLKKHMMLHTGERPFKCDQCDYACTKSSGLKQHKLVHGGLKPFKCPLCDYRCQQKQPLKKHIEKHSEPAEFLCSWCPYKITIKTYFNKHMRDKHPGKYNEFEVKQVNNDTHNSSTGIYNTDSGNQGLQNSNLNVTECKFDSTNNMSNINGYSLNNNEDTDKINHSLTGFSVDQLLQIKKDIDDRCLPKAHLDSKEESDETKKPRVEKPFPCTLCHFQFDTEPFLKAHMLEHAQELGQDPAQCPECPYSSKVFGVLKRHLLQAHYPATQQYLCFTCDFMSHCEDSLRRHINKQHANVPPKSFHCSVCSYSCRYKHSLKDHMHIHSDIAPYSCKECDFRCNKSANLRRHERTVHTDAKPFTCDVEGCSYSCKTIAQMRLHIRQFHSTEEAPYRCGLCEYASFRSSNLRRHMMHHTS